jgi:CheY-like chemotaxis protein
VPILLSDDKGSSPAQQSSEASTPTSLTGHVQLPSSEGTVLSADPWASEALEAASRELVTTESNKSELVATESNKIDGAVGEDTLLDGVSGERASVVEGSVDSEGESLSLKPTPPESTTADSPDPAQESVVSNADALPQEAPASTLPSDLPMSMGTASPNDALLPRDRDAARGVANTKPKRVLLIEDPRILNENLTMILKSEPDLAVVGQTGLPAECVNFGSAESRLDVAIVGLFLSDGQGISLIEGLRRSCPQIPLLVLTSGLDPADQERVLKAGADAVLAEDADPAEIVSTVRRLSPS